MTLDETLVKAITTDYERAAITAAEREMLDYAGKLTRDATAIGPADHHRLRAHGFDDAAIHDAIQVVGYFNYINRIAEGVGTDAEPEWATPGRP